MITVARVRELFTYDRNAGALLWRVSRGKARAGELAGTLRKGYLCVVADQRNYKVHRLVWLYHYGVWPEGHIDHVNGNRADNRIANLRDVTRSVNNQNLRHAQRNNKAGLLGVSTHKASGKFMATLWHPVERRQVYLGFHATPQAAHAKYLAAKRQLHSGCTL